MSLLIVDGYNIINSWPEFKSLREENMEGARSKLLEILQGYAPLAWQKIIVVFDAYQVKKQALSVEAYGGLGLEVVFTAEGQTADAYIERQVTLLVEKGMEVEVASSDYMEQNIVLWKGGRRISARELRERLRAIRGELLGGLRPPPGYSLLDERLPPRIKTTLEKWRRR